ncbi:MAG: hypothetical protein IKM57_07545 [Paludibacteraceae bacterium]|nr:hypothetical protein [Paludibacteraceae bacterium]
MNGMIINPNRSITIDFPIERVKQVAKLVDKVYEDVDPKDCSYDDILKVYKYKMDDHWTAGSYLILTMNEVSSNKTQLNIEMQRVLGAYDTESEVHFANKHMDMFLQAISQLLQKNEEELLAVGKSESLHSSSSGCTIFICVLSIVLIGLLLIIAAS